MLGGIGQIIYMITFNILFILLSISMAKTMFTDPGRVPLYWGYFLDDPEHKKRRYCLICHIFKPERCHHCSACNRCVLNMDHHCPWINNCVGFNNRKFFILMLMYVIVTSLFAALGMIIAVIDIVQSLQNSSTSNTQINGTGENWFQDIVIIIALILDIIALIVISVFFKFHMQLVLTNSTTIENLDKKRQSQKFQSTNFDMGYYYNWVQVFGKNTWLWPFPLVLESGKPVGDGIVWPQKYQEKEKEQNNDTENNFKSPASTKTFQNNIAKPDQGSQQQQISSTTQKIDTFQQTQTLSQQQQPVVPLQPPIDQQNNQKYYPQALGQNNNNYNIRSNNSNITFTNQQQSNNFETGSLNTLQQQPQQQQQQQQQYPNFSYNKSYPNQQNVNPGFNGNKEDSRNINFFVSNGGINGLNSYNKK